MALKAACLLAAGVLAARLLPTMHPTLSLPDDPVAAGLLPSTGLLESIPAALKPVTGWAAGMAVVVATLAALPHRSLSLPLLLALPGLWLGLANGGLPLWLTALYMLAAGLLARNMASTGLMTGLASLRPEQIITTLPMLFWRGQWAALLLAVLIPTTLLGLLWLQHGTTQLLSQLEAWQQLGTQLTTPSHTVSPDHISFFASLRLLGIAPWPALVAHVALALISLQMLWRVCRRALDPQLPLAAAITASLLLSPTLTAPWLSLLLMPLLIVLRRGQRFGWQADELLVVLATALCPLYVGILHNSYHAEITPLLLLLFLHTLKQHSRLDHHG